MDGSFPGQRIYSNLYSHEFAMKWCMLRATTNKQLDMTSVLTKHIDKYGRSNFDLIVFKIAGQSEWQDEL